MANRKFADLVKTPQETPSTNGSKPQETEHDRQTAQILAALDELGKTRVGEDGLIFQGDKMILPATMKGKIDTAIEYLKDYEEQQETEFAFSRTYHYRPWDGANAFQRAMRRVFGSSGIGVTIKTFFAKFPPEYRGVDVGVNETIQVPWGQVRFSPLEALFNLGATRHSEYGVVFQLSVNAPRKHRARIEAFFDFVQEELKTNSIYRGKAFTGGAEPQFVDLSKADPDQVIYTENVSVQLETNMWSLLRYSDAMRANGIDLKRAVLVEGPYGTGKSLAGLLTAQEAVANGWTFILARPGKDNLMEVLQTAQLYAPAVVWYEDIDVIAQGESDTQISQLLDALDSITNKSTEILAGFTTNHVHKIQKGVLRPGRLDAVIQIEGLDRDGFERLVRAVVPTGLLATNIDFDVVANAFDGMLPAFAKEAIARAVRYSISRNHGVPDTIHTVDLVNAAHGLRRQLDLMNDAIEGVHKPSLDSAFEDMVKDQVREQLNATRFIDSDGDTTTGDYAIALKVKE